MTTLEGRRSRGAGGLLRVRFPTPADVTLWRAWHRIHFQSRRAGECSLKPHYPGFNVAAAWRGRTSVEVSPESSKIGENL